MEANIHTPQRLEGESWAAYKHRRQLSREYNALMGERVTSGSNRRVKSDLRLGRLTSRAYYRQCKKSGAKFIGSLEALREHMKVQVNV